MAVAACKGIEHGLRCTPAGDCGCQTGRDACRRQNKKRRQCKQFRSFFTHFFLSFSLQNFHCSSLSFMCRSMCSSISLALKNLKRGDLVQSCKAAAASASSFASPLLDQMVSPCDGLCGVLSASFRACLLVSEIQRSAGM